ncbi:hypothetical protein DFJ74DRAFT_665028 [Hyaloraphidium curvatum]|nr:hypothetical protein DFJ74DRAFT_665028 [Hyaloraphidium curvatum]
MASHAEVEALRAEVASLKLRLNAEKAARAAAERMLAGAGLALPAPQDNEVVAIERAALPLELIVEIGKHLKSGSRTLVNMMLACRDFHEILFPLSLSSLDLKSMLQKPEVHIDRMLAANLADRRLRHVRELDAVGFDHGVRFAEMCPGLRSLKCSFTDSQEATNFWIAVEDHSFSELTYLEMHLDTRDMRFRFGLGDEPMDALQVATTRNTLPKLKHAFLSCDARARGTLVMLNAAASGLEVFECHLSNLNRLGESTDTALRPSLVPKVKVWRYGEIADFLHLVEVLPNFRPDALLPLDNDTRTRYVSPNQWERLAKLDFLRHVAFSLVGPWDLVDDRLPRNLETLTIGCLRLIGISRTSLLRLEATLRSRSSCRIRIQDFDRKGLQELDRTSISDFIGFGGNRAHGALNELRVWMRAENVTFTCDVGAVLAELELLQQDNVEPWESLDHITIPPPVPARTGRLRDWLTRFLASPPRFEIPLSSDIDQLGHNSDFSNPSDGMSHPPRRSVPVLTLDSSDEESDT